MGAASVSVVTPPPTTAPSASSSSSSSSEDCYNPAMSLLSSSPPSPTPRRSSSPISSPPSLSPPAPQSLSVSSSSPPSTTLTASKPRPEHYKSSRSLDGFRFGYQFKIPAPNIRRLIANGTEAETGLIPVFPTVTFPNHCPIVTGLYPPYHGIIYHCFVDPVSGDAFTMASHERKWGLGEPLWENAVAQGFNAATHFWPGSEVKKRPWTCPPKFCRHYNDSVPFEQKVDAMLDYFDLPIEKIPVFITPYFEDPDHQGHEVGPDDPAITAAVERMDTMIGSLISSLEKRVVFEDVPLILLGDHGMVGNWD